MTAVIISLVSSCAPTPPQKPANNTPVVSDSAPESIAVSSAVPVQTPTPASSEIVSSIPEAWRDNGIFSDCYERAYALLEPMTPEEKVGQLLLAHCPRSDAEGFIRRYQPGGFVLFESDFRGKTKAAVISMIQSFQNASQIPLIMAVDEEGGAVVRISRNPYLADHVFLSPQRIFRNGGFEAVRADTLFKAALLKELGLNLNLAPIADVSTNPGDFMYARAFGQQAAETAEYAEVVVSAMREMGISSSLKHFPGYGSNADTHNGAAQDKRPLSVFLQSDFIPFEKGIAAGAETILVSHNIIDCMEAGVPASLSPAVHRILRDDLHFSGIIITDDLGMGAVKQNEESTNRYMLAVLAGNDMLMVNDYQSAYDSILAAVKAGEIPAEVIDHAVFRILAWKLSGSISGGE
jgi:beta-N-acetylhexosaminidase